MLLYYFQSHICPFEYEMPRLLQQILNEPNLSEYLAPHFSPSNVGTANLLLMYNTISKEIGQKYDVTFALLSKVRNIPLVRIFFKEI